MKKGVPIILIGVIILTMLVPITSAFANTTSYLRNNPMYEAKSEMVTSGVSRRTLTDGDVETKFAIGYQTYMFYQFSSSVNVNAYSLIANKTTNDTRILFYNDGTLVKTISSSDLNIVGNQVLFEPILIDRVALYNNSASSTWTISEFEIFNVDSEIELPPVDPDPELIPPDPVTSLQVSEVTENSAKLTWQNPSNISGINIYKNNVLHTSLGVVSDYDIDGLTEGTQYKYSVSTVDKDGLESSLSNISFTTSLKEDNIPPAIPVNLVATGGSGAVYLAWDHVLDDDLLGYNIYLDGEKINGSLVKTNFYNVTNLEFGKEYIFQVSAVDRSGNESDKSMLAIGMPAKVGLPKLTTNYELKDVAIGIESWFSSFWLILAFAIAIPLSFYIAARVKLLFID